MMKFKTIMSIVVVGVLVCAGEESRAQSSLPDVGKTSETTQSTASQSILSAVMGALDQSNSSSRLRPELEADLLLSAIKEDQIMAIEQSSLVPSNESGNALSDKMAKPDTKLASKAVNQNQSMDGSEELNRRKVAIERVRQLLPNVKTIFPLAGLHYRPGLVLNPGIMLARLTLHTRVAAIVGTWSYKEAFDELLKATDRPFPTTECGAQFAPHDGQMYEWLDSIARLSKDESEQIDMLTRAMAVAHSQFAIGVYARAIERNDLSKPQGRRLAINFAQMLATMPVTKMVNGQILLTDFVNIRRLIEKLSPQSELRQLFIKSLDTYISRKVASGYCMDYQSTQPYAIERIMLTDILPKLGTSKIDDKKLPPDMLEQLELGIKAEQYPFISTNLKSILSGPGESEADDNAGLIRYVDRLLPGSNGFGRQNMVARLLAAWRYDERPAPPAVPTLSRAFTILDDPTFWDGDTENWRTTIRYYFDQIALADPAVRTQLMNQAMASQNDGIRLYAVLANAQQSGNPAKLETNRKAEQQ